MNRTERRRAEARNPAIADAYLSALQRDLDRASDVLGDLTEIVEDGRVARRDVASQEARLAEMIAAVGRLSANLAAARRASGLDHAA